MPLNKGHSFFCRKLSCNLYSFHILHPLPRIRKAAKKSPGNQQRTKKDSGETNNRLTVQSGGVQGVLVRLTVTLPTRDDAKLTL